MIPIRTDRRQQHRPWINYLLIAANVFVFIVIERTQSDWPAMRPYLLRPDQPQLYQFFTSMFLHADWWHLLGNMVFLWVFGNALNDSLGHVGYLAFYLAGGVVAGLGYVLMAGVAPVLGASGAISAVTGAFLVLFPRVRVTVLVPLVYVLMPFEISSLIFLALQFILNMYYSVNQAQSDVAYVAHASGYIFGIAVAAGGLVVRLLPRDVYDLPSLLNMWRRRRRYARVVAEGYDPFGRSLTQPGGTPPAQVAVEPPPGALPPPELSPREMELRRQVAAAHARGDFGAAADGYLQLVQLADDAVLPLPQQLDVANYLMSVEQYPAAADAYERFIRRYANYEYMADIRLMLGLLYSRYLNQDQAAEAYLSAAMKGLSDTRKQALARTELEKVRRRLAP